jgi:hypothetical protein
LIFELQRPLHHTGKNFGERCSAKLELMEKCKLPSYIKRLIRATRTY